jgi:hypothetical protein
MLSNDNLSVYHRRLTEIKIKKYKHSELQIKNIHEHFIARPINNIFKRNHLMLMY